MKKFLVLALVAVFAVTGIVILSNSAVFAKDAAAVTKPAAEQKVVCKFKTKEEMQEFKMLLIMIRA